MHARIRMRDMRPGSVHTHSLCAMPNRQLKTPPPEGEGVSEDNASSRLYTICGVSCVN